MWFNLRREMKMNGRTKSLIVCLAINAIALCVFAQAEDSTFAGKWDSTINNLIEHPKTVALRIEVVVLASLSHHSVLPGACCTVFSK